MVEYWGRQPERKSVEAWSNIAGSQNRYRLVAPYEPEAVLAGPAGAIITGSEQIRQFYARFLAKRSSFQRGMQRPPLRDGTIALASTQLMDGTVSVDTARRQPDGGRLWAVDQSATASAGIYSFELSREE